MEISGLGDDDGGGKYWLNIGEIQFLTNVLPTKSKISVKNSEKISITFLDCKHSGTLEIA